MTKAAATRSRILHQAAELFNLQGYAGSSISDIMQATGLRKGGIYNHFQSKDELAIAAFDYAMVRMAERYSTALKGKRRVRDRLHAVIGVMGRSVSDPVLAGGCPLLNTAVESDDAHPALRQRAIQAMDNWRGMIIKIINLGQSRGEINPHSDAHELATIVISTLEGSVMMSKLYDDPAHIQIVTRFLDSYIDSICLK
jgi:TetR/AcrR family transcriptional regulator, transcriptional repressor for nem operon